MLATVFRNKNNEVSGNQIKLFLLLFFFVLAVLVGESSRNVTSDPRGTLMVSQAIVQHGTIRLDSYDKSLLDSYGYVFHQKNGHYYSYFPLGTALIGVPFVAAANVLGLDIVRVDPLVQMAMVAFAAFFSLWILYGIARLYLTPLLSLSMVALAWFGSALASTLGTALWSHNFAFVFSSLAIFLVLKVRADGGGLKISILVGSCLFMAYFCRPVLALLVPFLLSYYFFKNRWAAVFAGLVFCALMAVFMGWSYFEFGQILPDYYQPKRLGNADFMLAVYGGLFSPARGLLVYSAFLVPSLLLSLLLAFRGGEYLKLSLITLAWPAAHLLSVSQLPHWWAGWSFGARFMADVLPGLLLGLFAVMQAFKGSRLLCGALILTGAASVFINTYQGLFNPYSVKWWNAEPNIDMNPQYLFDWRFPPFLHNEDRHRLRIEEHQSQAKQ
ncbi:hypothetical protein [Pseudomonas sp. Gutcm_11s]|uniref:hypothetical protein n=1 Tax=Pseudomonas sp. Gutcm_11s TaxID=3026088 RepID=UPI00235F7982|nr:hypothetical protein [Pseudomonas sp. Gutcm_11s]MDD0841865.1 hypothetical protein [Pseudomonas sp. Gutcm_11s]